MPGITEEPTGMSQPGEAASQDAADHLSENKPSRPQPDGKGSRPPKVKPALRSRIDSLFSDLRSAADETATLDMAPEQLPAAAERPAAPQPETDAFIPAPRPAVRPTAPPRKPRQPVSRPPASGKPASRPASLPSGSLPSGSLPPGSLFGIAISERGPESALAPLTPLGHDALASGSPSFVSGVEAADLGFNEAFMAVPFPVQTADQEASRGLLEVLDENAARYWSEDERRLVEQVTDQLSLALENARLFQETQDALQEAQERRSETDALYRASAELNAAQDYAEILEILRRSTIFGHPAAAAVSLSTFDRAPQAGVQPETLTVLARWSALADQADDSQPPETGALVGAAVPPELTQYLRPNRHTAIPDTSQTPLPGLSGLGLVEQPRSLVLVPLNVAGQWIGHLIAAYSEPANFGGKEIRPLMALASQAAVTVQNLRLFEETRRRASQLETAAEIARDTSGTLALDVLLNRAVNLIRDRYGYYHASIFLLDESGQTAIVRESTGMAGEEMKRRGHRLAVGSRSIIGQVTATGKLMVINDVAQDETFRSNPLLPDTHAELAIPFKVGSRIIGALDVHAIQAGAFTPDDVNVLSVLADQLAVAVDNARSYELAQQAISETAQRVEELSTVYDFSQSIAGASMQTQEIAQIICNRFIHLLPIDLAQVSLIEVPQMEEERRVRPANAPRLEQQQPEFLRMLAAQTPRGPAPLPVETTLLTDYPFMDTILQAGGSARPLILQATQPTGTARAVSTTIQGRRVEAPQYLQTLGLRSLLLIPLAIKGQVIGVVELRSGVYVVDPDAAQLNLLMAISNSAAVALENARLYEEQIATAEKMRELDQLKSAFLANMSHELRTPLNSIIGFSRVILKGIDGPISELQQQDLTAIHNAGAHLLSLINDVLDISKIEAGKMELAFDDNVNLTDLVNSAMSTAIGLTKDKPIRLERQIASDLPTVRADPTRIRQVLINFLSNAAKFTEEGTITVRAANSLSPDKRPEVLVSVTDSGPGISKENQAKLFQAFSQVDNSLTRKVGGTGLGLSISRLLIDLHGGRIGVDSEEGKGSTFYFALPVNWAPPIPEKPEETQPAAQPPAASQDDTLIQPAPRKRAPRILIIDDDRQVVNLYERYLEDQGYQVHSLNDPALALETALGFKPDAITLDINMPKKDGWQVLETLKNHPDTRTIPVIVCSIVAESEKAFSLGAMDYLTKPITEDDLIHALQRLRGNGPPISDVLVIDDDPATLTLVQKALTQGPSQITVRAALGGLKGLEALQQQPPDAVVLDLFMPDMDGFSLLETIRSNPATQAIPVLVFTAGDLSAEQAARVEDFSSQLIHKSAFEEKEFLQSIEGLLRRYERPAGQD